MLQCLGRRDPFLRVETQAPVEEVQEQAQFFNLGIWHPAGSLCHEARLQVPRRFLKVHNLGVQAAGDLVFLHAVEVEHFIKVVRRQGSAAKQLRRVLAPALHDGPKHLVVVSPREEDLARVQLKEGTANGPDIDGVVVRDTQDDLRGTVETTDEVRRNLIVRGRRRRT